MDAEIHLWGKMDADQHVDAIKVEVYWNGSLFHTENHKIDEDVDEQVPYEVKLSWFIPGYAPSGNYYVDLSILDNRQELGCERVIFTL